MPETERLVDFSNPDWRNEPKAFAEVLLADPAGDVQIDLSELLQPSTLHIQVLLSGARTFASQGRAFTLHSPAPALIQGLRTLGLSDEFTWGNA